MSCAQLFPLCNIVNTHTPSGPISKVLPYSLSVITHHDGELSDTGLLTLVPYHGASLSPAGQAYAEFLVKRHRILALALTHYGLSDDEACTEVSRFESLVSKEAIDRMCQAMGHPRQGICGEITHDTGCLGHGLGPA